MSFHIVYPRTIPERRPPNHQPAAPRWTLRWKTPVHTVISDYFAIQARTLPWDLQQAFIGRIRACLAHQDGPDAHEVMRCIDEAGFINTIVVAYWLDPTKHARWKLLSAFGGWFDLWSAYRKVWAIGVKPLLFPMIVMRRSIRSQIMKLASRDVPEDRSSQ